MDAYYRQKGGFFVKSITEGISFQYNKNKKVSLGISQLIESIICDALYQKGIAYDHC
jgi:hypothetical protein